MAEFLILRPGSRAPQVELLQLSLNRAGYDTGGIDGIFGRMTTAALLNFQRANGLKPDAIAGTETWRALTPYLTGSVRHSVKSGDTLYKLAQQYKTTIRAIETANPGIDALNLIPGTVITVPLGFQVVPENVSFTSTALNFSVTGLKLRYPFIEVGSAGISVMGKTLYYLKIGTGDNNVFYNASHHANEWITSPLLMRFLENYAAAYASGGNIFDTDARMLYNTTTLYIIPMVNPDGVDLVTGELDGGNYYDRARVYSANYSEIPFPSGWKANIDGIDLNLQYPAEWESARTIKFALGFTSPAPRDYVGTAPLTARESRAVYDFTRNHNFSLTLSYHTQGEVIYWKYLNFNPEGSYEIAQKFSAVSGYSIEETPYGSAYAGYKDWFIQDYNRPGYTIEAGLGIAPLPLSQFPEIYADNLGILTLGLTVTA
ncbi:MAG: M14 family metallopeptidase [Oscillospiraceae bacterium]